MERIVSTPDPGEFSRPLQNGHAPGRVVLADLREHEVPADPSPQLVAEQTRLLDADLAAFLAEESSAAQRAPLPGSEALPEHETLPGFEILTSADLRVCPDWCIHQDLPVHSDGFDPNPDEAPHRSVEHVIHAIHGGEGIDHAGRAEVSVQLEQDRDLSFGPTVTVAVTVQGIEQYAWLALPETRALQQALTHVLTEAEARNDNEAGADI